MKATHIKTVKAQRRCRIWTNIKRSKMLYLFLTPAFLWLAIFHYGPIYGVQIAFQKYLPGQIIGTSEWVGFKYFTQFFNSYWFPLVMKNTVVISLMTFLMSFPLAIVLALMLNEVMNLRVKKTIQTITYAPHFVSIVVLCGAIKLFLSPEIGIIGLAVNAIREMLGMEPINMLMKGDLFKWIYSLSTIWQETGWKSVIYFAALSAVDMQQVEAAKIDGASKLQRIWYINIPVLIPTIVIQLILSCGSLLKVGYEKVYLLQNQTILMNSEVISTYVYRSGISSAQFSFGAAVGLFENVINSVILIGINLIIRKIDDDLSLF